MQIKNPPAEITPSLMMLGTNEFPLYLWRSEKEGALFEGGVSAMGPVLKQQVGELDVDADTIKQLIITHSHPDHVMAVPMLRQLFPNLTVSASAAAAATLSSEKALASFTKMNQAFTKSLLQAGSIDEAHRPEPFSEIRIAVDRTLSEGDTITVGGACFNVLETPGHSDCSLSFHEPDQGVLIISDATGYYLPDRDCWWPNYFTGYGAYLDSMRRLSTLEAGTLCLSHNAVIQGVDAIKSYFQRAIKETETYHQRIVKDTRGGKSPREIAEQLGAEVYEKTTLLPLDFFQKSCGLLVNQSLEHEG